MHTADMIRLADDVDLSEFVHDCYVRGLYIELDGGVVRGGRCVCRGGCS